MIKLFKKKEIPSKNYYIVIVVTILVVLLMIFIRLFYLNYNKDKKSKHLDINGYVDKDVEKFLLRSGV